MHTCLNSASTVPHTNSSCRSSLSPVSKCPHLFSQDVPKRKEHKPDVWVHSQIQRDRELRSAVTGQKQTARIKNTQDRSITGFPSGTADENLPSCCGERCSVRGRKVIAGVAGSLCNTSAGEVQAFGSQVTAKITQKHWTLQATQDSPK